MIGYQEIECIVIFDVKMNFSCKPRFVASGRTTDTPGSITYSSAVSHDSVQLAFLIFRLNDLDVLAGDVTNAYLSAMCQEKIWFNGGIKTGEDSSVVSRDSVQLAFVISGLTTRDVTNAHLNAMCQDKIWFNIGIKTGEDKG